MPRRQKRYHFIYKTVNKINGKFYIGMHSTDNLNDGYIGSGRRLWYSINKHGKENHVFEILEFLSNRKDLASREKEIVNEELLSNPQCLNLKIGGSGGGKIWNAEHEAAFRKAASDATKKRISEKGQPFKCLEKLSPWNDKTRCDWNGRKHSEETKLKLKKSKNKGEANSQFGTSWIYKDNEVKKVKREELELWLDEGWKKGRFILNKNE